MEIPTLVLSDGARRFGLDAVELHYIGGMDGAVFETTQNGKPYVIKFEPADAERLPRIREKFEFIDYLARGGVCVAAPAPVKSGCLVELVESEQGSFAVTRSEKAPGKHLETRDPAVWNEAFFRRWGSVLGQMHALTQKYPLWRRHDDENDSHPETAIMDWRMEHKSFLDWGKDEQVREHWVRLGQELEKLPLERGSFGLIHNDLHQWNFLVEDNTLTVIDFDVCSYHWFITDIAIALYHAMWEGHDEQTETFPDYVRSFLREFLVGYREHNELDGFWLSQIPTFLKYRQILLYTVFSNTWQKPLNEWQREALRSMRVGILSGRKVFEFDLF